MRTRERGTPASSAKKRTHSSFALPSTGGAASESFQEPPSRPASADLLARAGHLLGIHKALRILFPQDRDLAYQWVSTPNRRFGATPLEIMKRHGYEGILAVRRYLDFERGR